MDSFFECLISFHLLWCISRKYPFLYLSYDHYIENFLSLFDYSMAKKYVLYDMYILPA